MIYKGNNGITTQNRKEKNSAKNGKIDTMIYFEQLKAYE